MQKSTQFLLSILCLFINGIFMDFIPTPPIVFSPADYIFLVPEESQIGTSIGRLNPISNEIGIVVSSIVIGTTSFEIDSNYYVTTAMSAPDYETFSSGPIEFQIQFTYTFETHDYSITSNITVFVTDVNDNIPEFLSSTYSFTFTEDLRSSSLIGFVFAFDKDSNPFNCIGYSVTPPINGTNSITITEEGGVVTLEPFTNGTFVYEIVATDSGEPPQSTSATLEIIVTQSRTPAEVVDPILQQTEYHFFAREDVSLDTDLGIVTANRDPTIVSNSSFLYSVAQGMVFQFDVSSGVLSNRVDTFDFESGVTNYTYPALVRLSIEGSAEVTRQDTSPLTVYLRNVNEHSPVVAMEPFSVIMSADVPVGSVIGKLPLVTDFDGQNGFNFSLVTDSPFGMNDTGFVYVKYPLDTSITSYSLAYTIEDKPLLGDTKTTSATIIITVTPASVPPELLQPTRDVSYIHTCTSITSHSFRFTWLPPTDNSNPVNYNLTITCTFRPLLQEVYAVIVTAPLAVVVISRTFDRFTECEYLLSPFPDGPSVQGQMDQLSFNNLVGAQYFVQITNRDFINIQISNITMCLYDLHGNEQIFDTQVFLSDDTTQVAQFDASYANYYDSETETLSLVGYLSSGSNILQSGTNYSVSIQFPVNVNRLYYQWYTHDLVSVPLKSGTLSWTQTCTPAFYTFSQSDSSIIDTSCQFVFMHASTANSFYQSLLPSSEALSITVRDTLYRATQWDSDVLATIKVTQLCGYNFTPLYSDDIVQQLFLMRPGYTLTDVTTAVKLELTVHPMFICSLYFTPTSDVSELTTAFQTTYDVTMEVSNETTADDYTCSISAPILNQLTIPMFTPNSQIAPAVEFFGLYPLNLTLECDWSLTPGGVYSGRGVIQPLSSFRLTQTVTLKSFTFQIDPIDDNQIPKDLLVPYGTINGDTLLPKGQHVTSSPITLPNYFLIGSLYTDIAYVSNKGLISFGDPFTSPYPEIFPGYSERTKNAYIVAPFWANIDTTFLGEVSWQLHSDATLLSRLSSIVGGGFGARSALAVTWYKVRPFPAHGDVYSNCLLIGQNYMPSCTQHNTFQAVILSDGGVNTHVLFSYNCEDFHWSKSSFNAAIGFNSGGSYFNNHHLSTTNDVNLVPCSNPEGAEYPQTVISYTLSSTPGEEPTKTQSELCRDRIASATPAGDTLPSDYTLRSCPGDLLSAQSDFRFYPHTTLPYCVTPVYPASDSQSILCCYSIATGTFLSHLSTYLRYSPLAVTQYVIHEEGFFSLCCATRATCEEYYQVRPKVSQNGFENSGISGGFGDPHFITFDGFEYSFNRIGEFVLTENGFFEAQIRTTQLDTFQATYTSAIVLKSSTSDVVQIEVAADTIVAYTTNRVTLTPLNFPLFHEGLDFKISTKSTNQILVVFSTGVSVIVALKSGALIYQISLPSSYSDTLTGLLGNWNGNQSDDHVQSDGVLVNLSPLTPLAREMALDTFGRSWAVTTSLFQYPPSEDTDTYTDTSFVPVYLSNLILTPEAMNICGSSTACLYDFLVTNDTILATNTLQAQNDISELQSLFATSPPTIRTVNGETDISVRLDVWYQFLFEVFDPLGVYEVGVSSILTNVELELTNNLTDFRKYYTLRFLVAESEKDTIFGLTVWVQSRTNVVVGFSFVLSVCDCDFGICSNSSFTEENFLLQYGKQACVCDKGYSGSTCSEDLDGCVDLQCYPEVVCVDLPPPSLVAECATCPNGTTGDGQDCEDYNECVNDRSNDHTCTTLEYCRNVVESFVCDCIEGYERNSEGICEDVDECDNPICHQKCVNTLGSYSCDCVAGLTLSSDTFSCEPIVSCATSKCDTESQLCAMIATNEICFCKMGFMPSETNSFSCLDSNECVTQICTQECDNRIGGYTCICETGYSLSYDNRTCVDVNECTTSATCEDTFICSNLIGSFKCVDPLNPFPFNSSTPVFFLDVPAIVAGTIFAGVTFILILIILIYVFYKDFWRLWRRRGGRDDRIESEIESGTNFNIFRNR